DFRHDQCADDGQRHPELSGPDTPSRGRRSAKPFERKHKQRGRNEVADLGEQRLCAHFSAPRFLNMRSILSVMRKPLTTLIVDAVTASAPRMVVNVLFCSPRMTRDPIKLIADIALVRDMSGVWRSGETRRMTSKPKNVARTKT